MVKKRLVIVLDTVINHIGLCFSQELENMVCFPRNVGYCFKVFSRITFIRVIPLKRHLAIRDIKSCGIS